MIRILLGLLLLSATASGCRPTEQPRPSGIHLRKPRVAVAEATAREIEYVVEAAGSVEAREEISIPARVSGILDAVRFQEGDAVGEETVLAEIEVERYRLGEERAKAEFDHARAQAELAETVYRNRLALHEEGKKLKKEWVTDEQMAVWRADLEKARADQERSRVDLELAARSHRDARVRPPIRGLINRKLVSKGEFVKPETVVATILNLETLHVRFTVPELEASRLAPGQEITFSVGSTNAAFKAKLFHLNQKADAFTRAVECKAEVQGRDNALRAGTFATIRTVTGRQAGIIVPERAVLPTERGFIVSVVEQGRVKHRIVTPGLRIDGGIEIRKGLGTGEKIIVDGGAGLREGMEVDVAPPEDSK